MPDPLVSASVPLCLLTRPPSLERPPPPLSEKESFCFSLLPPRASYCIPKGLDRGLRHGRHASTFLSFYGLNGKDEDGLKREKEMNLDG